MADATSVHGRGAMRMLSVAALGIGSMVGAGIFALLGQAALMTGSDVYLSFAIGGVIALLSGYSYSRLAARYPSSGGILDYFDRAFSSKVTAGGLSILYLVTQIVSIAMIAKTFGAYTDRLLIGDASEPHVANAFASGIVIFLVVVNMIGSGTVGRIEELLVAAKLIILAILLLAGVPSIDPAMVTAGPTVSPATLFASVGLTFFAYAGYGMMTNAAGHVARPEVTIPRAIFLAIGTVIVLYIGLSVVVLGNISQADLARFASTAVAQAAQPVLGNVGFVLVSIGALFATSSAITAALFCVLEISRGLAAKGQLPAVFEQPSWRHGTRGLLWVAGAILVMVNVFDLGSIAQVAGATFLISYLGVFAAHWRLHSEVGGSRLVIVVGTALMTVVLAAFAVSLWSTQPSAIAFTVLAVLGSLAVEWLVQRRRRTT
ncbi:MAG: amino acid permease [Enhydrobacter sp.]|nr:MAG: amino acid permease [Enhydrobacter sp.]